MLPFGDNKKHFVARNVGGINDNQWSGKVLQVFVDGVHNSPLVKEYGTPNHHGFVSAPIVCHFCQDLDALEP